MDLVDGEPDSPVGPVELLDDRPAPPAPRPSSPRRAAALLLALAVGVAAGGWGGVSHARQEYRARQAAAARSVFDVVVLGASASEGDPGSVYAVVRNAGTLPLSGVSVTIGGLPLSGPPGIPAGASWTGSAALPSPCTTGSSPTPGGPIVVTARTADGRTRTRTLQPVDDYLVTVDSLQAPSCAPRSFSAAFVSVTVVHSAEVGRGAYRLVLALRGQSPSAGLRPRLTGVHGALPGVRVRAESALGIQLSSRPVLVPVLLDVPSCARLRLPADLSGAALLQFTGTLEPGGYAGTTSGYDDNVLATVVRAAERSCPQVAR
ncbi:hypothetical protein EV189_2645 [Motilibacter rhizosphaerae]|uniref:Uncharacterized protein n=1 Tax=Motilibacter rhizosphaerae TaxID=598652 RepID=A0A4Q7NRF9_9ACTN|nr:hypothetical protein [Motilibacter rhizosphaerae]RZS87220.1 hypothetical protein EV189_2645 [Motilibacter rhizosphaerae]